MSSPSQPRRRPRPKPKAAAPATQPKSTDDDDRDFFTANHARSEVDWLQLQNADRAVNARKRATPSDSDSDDMQANSRSKSKKKLKSPKIPKFKDAPVVILSSDEDSDIMIQETTNTPGGRRRDKGKARRSRSRSLTPPPALPAQHIMNARDVVRRALGGQAKRDRSPTGWEEESTVDTIILAPELQEMAKNIASQSQLSAGRLRAVPSDKDDSVLLKVKWVPHPLLQNGKAQEWDFRLGRMEDFRDLFGAVAEAASVFSDDVVLTYAGKRFYPSVTPNTLHLWGEAELLAYTKSAYQYVRQQEIEASRASAEPDPDILEITSGPDEPIPSSGLPDYNDASESENEDSKFKIIVRSNLTKTDFKIIVRPTTTCGAIVRTFITKAGLAKDYPEVFANTSPKKGGGRKSQAKKKDPRLSIDGDKLDNGTQISELDLEDGDLVEVVGL